MIEIAGDLWEAHELGHFVVITTNGDVNKKDEAVMGRGVALQAKLRFPDLALSLGSLLRAEGNHVHVLPQHRIITFPVKHHWYEKADKTLIVKSARELRSSGGGLRGPLYMVRPGCGNGGLKWEDVKPSLALLLPGDRYVVVEKSS